MTDKLRRYEKLEFLGEGQFATVYKAKDLWNNNKIVAIKKIKVGRKTEMDDGVNRTAIREIKLMQELHHANIINLLDVVGKKSNISLVFDFMVTDLEAIIRDSSLVLTMANIKAYILQTFLGLEYLHASWILHRDLKPNNLLIDDQGILKIGDFGLAKYFGSPDREYTAQVVTRWYRPAELIFGARFYSTGIDIWSTACILAELLLRGPFLPGENDLDQLDKIFNVVGTPTEENWPNVNCLPSYIVFQPRPPKPLISFFSAAPDDLIDLLGMLLNIDPLKRCTATEALQTTYFTNKPSPSMFIDLPRPSMTSRNNKNNAVKNTRLKHFDAEEMKAIGSNKAKKLLF